jgi:hypothetical protein
MDVLAESSMPGGAQVLFLLGLGSMIVILLIRSRRYFRQVTQYQVPTPRAKPARKPVSASSAPPKDYEKWEVSMHETARDLSGQLDTKIRVLELLIREANDAAARLETAMDRRSEVGSRKSEPRDTRERAEPISRDIHAALEPKRATPSRESKAPLKIAGNPRFERIFALADAGMSPAKIANQIGSQVGEVELILSLRSSSSQTAEPQKE